MRSEASRVMLRGAAQLPASSGMTRRHRPTTCPTPASPPPAGKITAMTPPRNNNVTTSGRAASCPACTAPFIPLAGSDTAPRPAGRKPSAAASRQPRRRHHPPAPPPPSQHLPVRRLRPALPQRPTVPRLQPAQPATRPRRPVPLPRRARQHHRSDRTRHPTNRKASTAPR